MVRKGPDPFFSLASGLHLLSWLYGAIMRLRRIFYERGFITRHRLPCFVISVGNLCVGGTGKTPLTLHLAELLRNMGLKVAVISRGYRGSGEKNGCVVSDGQNILCEARHAGDEPYLIASLIQNVPVVVGKDRVAAGKTSLKQFKPDVLVLDDGFQHLRLKRDLNLLLLDARKPFGNGFVLPRGTLREPTSAIDDADAVIVTRCNIATPGAGMEPFRRRSQPVFHASHRSVLRGILPAHTRPAGGFGDQLTAADRGKLKGMRVFAFSGLADNNAFWSSLSTWGAELGGVMGFSDHHPYNVSDIRHIVRTAQTTGSDCLVTTDKDYVKLPHEVRLSMDLIVLGIFMDFGPDQEKWQQLIIDQVGRNYNTKV